MARPANGGSGGPFPSHHLTVPQLITMDIEIAGATRHRVRGSRSILRPRTRTAALWPPKDSSTCLRTATLSTWHGAAYWWFILFSGVQVYDARLVAAMHVHKVNQILTFNARHFVRYPGITVLDPQTVTPNSKQP
jgi:hypothetical protein